MTFHGFPDDLLSFYEGLEADNSRSYWLANKATYDSAVKAPMLALLEALADEFGTGHAFRPNRDVRFSKEKLPYKNHQGGFVEIADAVGYYVQVSADGLLVAGGWYSPQGEQLARYRDVVDGPAGAELERIVTALGSTHYAKGGDQLKTRPRGTDPDHPRLDLLRHRSLIASQDFAPEPWLATGEVLARVRAGWRTVAPLVEWLAGAVGPGTDPEKGHR